MNKNEKLLKKQIIWVIICILTFTIYQLINIFGTFNVDITSTLVNYIHMTSLYLWLISFVCVYIYVIKAKSKKLITKDEYTQVIAFKVYRFSCLTMFGSIIVLTFLTFATSLPLKLSSSNIMSILLLIAFLSILIPNVIYSLKE